ncbi:MAG: carbohydrate ABC transporter permease [Rectinemataceae bacterium]|jgi:multiple sugar transport system permease protein/raffinose/stachyose/melibiose transport system permease protein
MKKALRKIILVTILFIWMVPTLWLAVTSLKAEKDVVTDTLTFFSTIPTLTNYAKAFGKTGIATWLLNSAIVSSVTMLFTLALDSLIAFALARIRFRGRNALFIFVLAGMMVPFEAIIIQLYLLFNALGLINTLSAIIIPRLALPIGVFILVQFFKGIPVALEEAAYMDGASRFKIFLAIILPLGKSALVTVMILSFINGWNDFLWPLVVASDSLKYTVTVGIANFQGTHGTEYSLIMAGAVIASAPQIAMFLFFREHIVKGIAMTGIKG